VEREEREKREMVLAKFIYTCWTRYRTIWSTYHSSACSFFTIISQHSHVIITVDYTKMDTHLYKEVVHHAVQICHIFSLQDKSKMEIEKNKL
jgi:hypothetical protein